MPTPAVPHSATGTAGSVSSIALGALTATTGDSVYVFVTENQASSRITSLGDGTNTYTLKATVTEGGVHGPVTTVWVSDNVSAGGGSLSISINFSTTVIGGAVAFDVTGAKSSGSFGGAGPGTSGSYATGTNESDSVSPSDPAALLVGLLGISLVGASGSPSATWNAVGGESLVASASGLFVTGHSRTGLGAYTIAASGTGSQQVTGNATVSIAGTYAMLAIYILSPSSPSSTVSGATLPLMGVVELIRRAARRARRPRSPWRPIPSAA